MRHCDARWSNAKNDADYTQPGEGDGAVHRIVKDLLANGYDRGFSMEPHVAAVFHDPTITAPEQVLHDSFVDYGRAFMRLIAGIQVELNGEKDLASASALAGK